MKKGVFSANPNLVLYQPKVSNIEDKIIDNTDYCLVRMV